MASFKSLFFREKLYAHAVDSISFEIKKGEFVGFIGPNGAGKTTTLKMLSGILYPTSGEVRVAGYNPWKRERAFQKKFALVMGQKNQLWWDLPPIESFHLFKEMYEIPKTQFKKNLDFLSELLNVQSILEVQVRKLSLGQRMKCELIGALLHDPEILFLDEPTIGLDIISQSNIRQFLTRYNEEKKATIILTSHYMEDIKRLCNRIIIINKGKILYDGSYLAFTKSHAKEKIVEVEFKQPVSLLDAKKYGNVVEFGQNRAHFLVPQSLLTKTTGSILATLPVENISIHEKSLEELTREFF